MSAGDADDESEDPVRGDLMADLFFGLGAIFLIAVVLLAPTLGVATGRARAEADATARRLAETRLTRAGTPVATLFAGPTGVGAEGAAQRIALDDIADSPRLAALLAEARRSGELLLVVEVGGEEAAFALEPVIAAAGPPSIRQLRLDRGCGFARSPAAASLCGAGP